MVGHHTARFAAGEPAASTRRSDARSAGHARACAARTSARHDGRPDWRASQRKRSKAMQRSYRSYDEFTREEIRPLSRVGFSIDEFDIDNHYQEEILFDQASDDDDDE